MVYTAPPPYEILQNKLIPFADMQRLRRFAKYWDLVGNSGNFVETCPLLWSGHASPFQNFLRFSDWLFARLRRTDTIALARLAELLFRFLKEEMKLDATLTAATLWRDYQRGGRNDKPGFLAPHLSGEPVAPRSKQRTSLPKRQARHTPVESAGG